MDAEEVFTFHALEGEKLHAKVAKALKREKDAHRREKEARHAQKIAEKCERVVQNGRRIAEEMVHRCETELERLGGLLDKEKRMHAADLEYLGRMWPKGSMPPSLLAASVEACLRRRRRRQLERSERRREWRKQRAKVRAYERKVWPRKNDPTVEGHWRVEGGGGSDDEQEEGGGEAASSQPGGAPPSAGAGASAGEGEVDDVSLTLRRGVGAAVQLARDRTPLRGFEERYDRLW
jgi:hypothetical protein